MIPIAKQHLHLDADGTVIVTDFFDGDVDYDLADSHYDCDCENVHRVHTDFDQENALVNWDYVDAYCYCGGNWGCGALQSGS